MTQTNDKPRVDPGFVDLVEKMRKAQADYFDKKHARALDKAKQLERLVDIYITTYRKECAKLEAWQNVVDENRGSDGTYNMPLL